MNADTPLPPHDRCPSVGSSLRDAVVSARRYWERRRLAYNLVLTALVIGLVVYTWPHFRPVFTFPAFLQALAYLMFLAGLANICYCAAYPLDLALQKLAPPPWLRRGRPLLWWAGLLFANALAIYWVVDEIY